MVALLTSVGGLLVLFFVLFLLSGIRYIPNNKIGIIEKRISGKGSLKSGIIAMNGEAGFQPQMMRGGLHYLMPVQYAVHVLPLVTIPQGKIGYIFSRDGQQLPASQTLASNLTADDFQDATVFLKAGGQRGPQRKILREGTYAIQLAQFVVRWGFFGLRAQRGGGGNWCCDRRRRRQRRQPGWLRRFRRGPCLLRWRLKRCSAID